MIADLNKSEDLNRLLNETIKTFGKLDVLVNNAGFGRNSLIKDKNFMNTFDEIFKVNLRAVVELIHLSIPYLNKTNGTIINISSIASIHPVFYFYFLIPIFNRFSKFYKTWYL